MINCLICEKELLEGEETVIHYQFLMHKNCEPLFIDYGNRTYRDYATCKCGTHVEITCLVKQNKQVGIGKCKCGKVYITFRFPKNPSPRKIKAPHRLTDEEMKHNMM